MDTPEDLERQQDPATGIRALISRLDKGQAVTPSICPLASWNLERWFKALIEIERTNLVPVLVDQLQAEHEEDPRMRGIIALGIHRYDETAALNLIESTRTPEDFVACALIQHHAEFTRDAINTLGVGTRTYPAAYSLHRILGDLNWEAGSRTRARMSYHSYLKLQRPGRSLQGMGRARARAHGHYPHLDPSSRRAYIRAGWGRVLLGADHPDGGPYPMPFHERSFLTDVDVVRILHQLFLFKQQWGWPFDGVLAERAADAPLAEFIANRLETPFLQTVPAGSTQTILVVQGVSRGENPPDHIRAARDSGMRIVRFALLTLSEDLWFDPPDLIGELGAPGARWSMPCVPPPPDRRLDPLTNPRSLDGSSVSSSSSPSPQSLEKWIQGIARLMPRIHSYPSEILPAGQNQKFAPAVRQWVTWKWDSAPTPVSAEETVTRDPPIPDDALWRRPHGIHQTPLEWSGDFSPTSFPTDKDSYKSAWLSIPVRLESARRVLCASVSRPLKVLETHDEAKARSTSGAISLLRGQFEEGPYFVCALRELSQVDGALTDQDLNRILEEERWRDLAPTLAVAFDHDPGFKARMIDWVRLIDPTRLEELSILFVQALVDAAVTNSLLPAMVRGSSGLIENLILPALAERIDVTKFRHPEQCWGTLTLLRTLDIKEATTWIDRRRCAILRQALRPEDADQANP